MRRTIWCLQLVLILLVSIHAYSLLRSIKSNTKFCIKQLYSSTRPDVEEKQIKGLIDGLKFRRLPGSDLYLSQVGIGADTFGEKVSEKVCHQILDQATKEYAINFIDTGEMGPVPYAESMFGVSDIILGKWIKKQPKLMRDGLVLSGRICGGSDSITWARNNHSPTRINRKQVVEAVDGILERLNVDHLDILTLEWPDRYTGINGAVYNYDYEREDIIPIKEQLEALDELIKSGKIKHYALSNESPYGVGCFTTTADILGLPRPIAVQKPYNLLERHEVDNHFMEICSRKAGNVPVIGYSPLAGGALTNKYENINKADPEGRLVKFSGFMYRYINPTSSEATKKYADLAKNLGLPLHIFSLGWTFNRPHIISTLMGVTSLAQLDENFLALNIRDMDQSITDDVDKIYYEFPDPTRGVNEPFNPYGIIVDFDLMPWGGAASGDDVDPKFSDAVLDDEDDLFDDDGDNSSNDSDDDADMEQESGDGDTD